MRKHGRRYHPLYSVWDNMLARCRNPLASGWRNYGARGILVCARWHEFSAFLADMGPTYRPGLTIERRDTDGNYTPENCTWVTRKAQAYNRRNNRYVDTPWGRMTLMEAAERIDVQAATLLHRLRTMTDIDRIYSPVSLRDGGRLTPTRKKA